MSLHDDITTIGEYFEPIELVPTDPDTAPVAAELVRALTADIRHATRRKMLNTPALAEELIRRGWRPVVDTSAQFMGAGDIEAAYSFERGPTPTAPKETRP